MYKSKIKSSFARTARYSKESGTKPHKVMLEDWKDSTHLRHRQYLPHRENIYDGKEHEPGGSGSILCWEGGDRVWGLNTILAGW